MITVSSEYSRRTSSRQMVIAFSVSIISLLFRLFVGLTHYDHYTALLVQKYVQQGIKKCVPRETHRKSMPLTCCYAISILFRVWVKREHTFCQGIVLETDESFIRLRGIFIVAQIFAHVNDLCAFLSRFVDWVVGKIGRMMLTEYKTINNFVNCK